MNGISTSRPSIVRGNVTNPTETTAASPVHRFSFSKGALRLLDLGHLSAVDLHRAYLGLAEAQGESDPPLLILASAEDHLSVGAAQGVGAELDREACVAAGIPVVQRPLGGGTVWVDRRHLNYFLVLPRQTGIRRPAEAMARFAPILCAWHRSFGLDVRLVGDQDFWLDRQKLGGTGAASIGCSLVLGGSLLLDGDWGGFVRCIAAPSADYRVALRRILEESLGSWARHLPRLPAREALGAALREALAAAGWDPQVEDAPRAREVQAMAQAELEAADWQQPGRRRVAHGIKIKNGSFLTERHWPDGSFLRVWTEAGRYRRVWCSAWSQDGARAMAGLERQAALQFLEHSLDREDARLWQARLEATAVWAED